jgi:hypothetical protein
MKKKTKIILGSLCTLSVLGVLAFFAFVFLVIYGMIQAMGPSPKPPIGIVDGEIAKDTNESYIFVRNRTNLNFPDGTKIDAAPGGWGMIELTCFTIPKEDIDSFIATNQLTFSSRDKTTGLQEAVGVSKKNQKLPTDAQLAAQKNPPKTKQEKYMGYDLYFHKQSGRLWVVCYVKAPYD